MASCEQESNTGGMRAAGPSSSAGRRKGSMVQLAVEKPGPLTNVSRGLDLPLSPAAVPLDVRDWFVPTMASALLDRLSVGTTRPPGAARLHGHENERDALVRHQAQQSNPETRLSALRHRSLCSGVRLALQ